MLQHMSHSEAARSRLRRQGIQGASTQAERVLADDFLATGHRLGHLIHGPDQWQALSAMRRRVDFLGRNGAPGEGIRLSAALHELEQRVNPGDGSVGVLGQVARRMSGWGYVYSLMSPSHMLTSTIEAHMNSTALLGTRHGYVRANLALAKAMKDITPTMTKAGIKATFKAVGQGLKAADWNMAHSVRDRLIAGGADKAAMMKLFGKLNDAGLIDHSFVRELQVISQPGYDVTRGWWHRFMDLNGAGAHAVDVANKSAIAKAAYDLEFRKTGSVDGAVDYAVEKAREAMPNYNAANKARIATAKGPLGQMAGPIMQFKNYGVHMYAMMGNLLRSSIHGASRAERMEARKAFAGILATHAMMAGVLTLLPDPIKWALGAYDWATGAQQPHDYENDVRSWIASAFGPEVGEVISRGLPHALGIDVHRRIGLSNLLELPEIDSFKADGFGKALATAAFGAAGEDATQMAAAAPKLFPGPNFDPFNALKGLVPRVIRDPMKALALAQSGVTNARGQTLLPTSKLAPTDVAVQAAGFIPADVSEFHEGRSAVIEARQEMQEERSQILQRFVGARDRGTVLPDVQAYNLEHPGSPITYSQLLQALKRGAATGVGPFGLTLPKTAARELARKGAFTNP